MSKAEICPVSAIILAGGLARRLGGRDKGLIPLANQPLAAWVVRRISGQVSEVLLSANRNLAEYAALGHTVVPDYLPGRPGPLAGVLAAARTASREWMLVLPCDVPFLPLDLAQRLYRHAIETNARLLRAADETGEHYAMMLMHRDLVPDLAGYVEAGGRQVRAWQEQNRAESVLFGDDPYAFLNINTPDELRTAERVASRYPS
ncbi:MAG: molybdenum cofactor guanylyltransferase [Betaproteobacteria bacterium]|nr:molybdenum cofactor guanylyltransferase [Betaproteobacteria bacterium]